jgi:hypothetical protein
MTKTSIDALEGHTNSVRFLSFIKPITTTSPRNDWAIKIWNIESQACNDTPQIAHKRASFKPNNNLELSYLKIVKLLL